MSVIFEFRVRFVGDVRKWEEIPVTDKAELASGVAARTRAIDIRRGAGTEKVREVRFNALGSSQGHYV